MDKNNYLGKNKNGEHVFQELENGAIRGFSWYYVAELPCGTLAFDNCAWTHSANLEDGRTLVSGQVAAQPVALPDDLADVYAYNIIGCSECGQAHDADDYRPGFIIIDCEAYCKECVPAGAALIELNEPADLFKSRDVQGVDLTGYTEVETLFCDSSGLGSDSESAYTKRQATAAVQAIIDRSRGQLYAGLTGMGQFQVYVTIYKKSRARKRA